MSRFNFSPYFYTAILVFAAIGATTQAGAAEITSSATARWGSGNTTFDEQSVSGITLPANGTSGVQSVSNGDLSAAGVGTSSLANNSIGSAAAWAGSSILTTPNSGPNWTTFSTGRVDFDDSIIVQSNLLAIGTPVQINFALAAASSLAATHTVSQGGTKNEARAELRINGSVTTVGGPGDSVFISSGDHNAQLGTNGTILSLQSGLLDPNTPTLNFTFDTEVGAELRFFMRITANAIGGVAPNAPTLFAPLENQSGFAAAQLGLAFGGTANSPDVILQSALFGGAFPLASQATVVAALSGQPPPPVVVPVPPALAMMLTILPGLFYRRRRSPANLTLMHTAKASLTRTGKSG